MSINLQLPKLTDLKPRISVIGVGGAGGNAINNMIASGLSGVEFIAANTDAQALQTSSADRRIQLGAKLTEGLGAGSKPEIGQAAAEEALDDIKAEVSGAHMIFIAAGMGGGTGTGAAAVIARVAREMGILTVGVVTKPFQFEGARRMRTAQAGIAELEKYVDTLIVIPNQNLFRVASEKTTFAEAFVLADQVLYAGIACIVDLIVKEGLINLDFADVRTVISGMGSAMMGTGEAEGERRAIRAAEEAIANPLLDDVTLKGAKGLLLSIIGGRDMTLYEVDEAASRVRQEIDPDANVIVGATFEESMGTRIRVAIVASGMQQPRSASAPEASNPQRIVSPPPLSNVVTLPLAASTPTRTTSMPPPLPPLPALMRSQDAAEPRTAWTLSADASVPPPAPLGQPSSAPRELWRAPGNVVIEEAPRRQYSIAARASNQAPLSPPDAARTFVPASPDDVQRGQLRSVDLRIEPDAADLHSMSMYSQTRSQDEGISSSSRLEAVPKARSGLIGRFVKTSLGPPPAGEQAPERAAAEISNQAEKKGMFGRDLSFLFNRNKA